MAVNFVETYLLEADELLAEIEAAALTLSGPQAPEVVHQLFRNFHTIKGSGAMCGFDRLARFTHQVESLLDRVRDGAVPISSGLTDVVLAAKDHIKELLAAGQTGAAATPGAEASIAAMIAALNADASGGPRPAAPPPAAADGPAEAGPPPFRRAWNIRFRPNPNLLAFGGNPALLFRDLGKLGACEICAHTDRIPPLDRIQPDSCYLWWTARLQTEADLAAIRDVFLFVEDGAELEITPLEITPQDADAPPLAVAPPVDPGSARPVVRESTVRVTAGRLDRLVGLVGELVMNQSRLTQAAAHAGVPELAAPVEELERLIAELRDEVLGIRMMPIGAIFGRFRRLVRDLSAELGKEIDLVTEGEDTELDKSVLDRLGEPLVHLLRNSIDHGIEAPEERVARGKPRRGAIYLTAEHTGADVVVRIADDGRGLDRDAIRAKASQKGIIAPDANLSDKEILNLVMLPGFSTAARVTSVSGRGVGLDVVKKEIESLRGSVAVGNGPAHGAVFSLRLPLTLAIIDGLLVEIGMDRFIIPMAAVRENVELHRGDRSRRNGRNVIAIRGKLAPYIDLRAEFGVGGTEPAIEKIVVVHHDDQRVGLLVDRVLGAHQTVIQSLGRFFRGIDVISGTTIMGDGRVALILDPAAVVRFADRKDAHGVAEEIARRSK